MSEKKHKKKNKKKHKKKNLSGRCTRQLAQNVVKKLKSHLNQTRKGRFTAGTATSNANQDDRGQEDTKQSHNF